MAYARPFSPPPDIECWSLEGSRLALRGPRPRLEGADIAVSVLGGSASFGRFVIHPFPELLAHRLDRPCMNLAAPHAGLEAILGDGALVAAASLAEVVVVELLPAERMTTSMWQVHPRRNDRIIAPGNELRLLFPEVEYADIHFVGHLLRVLRGTSTTRFAIVEARLIEAWLARMRELCAALARPVVLLEFEPPGNEAPAPTIRPRAEDLAGLELAGHVRIPPPASRPRLEAIFQRNAPEWRAATSLPPPSAHRAAARELEKVLRPLLGARGRRSATSKRDTDAPARSARQDGPADRAPGTQSGSAPRRNDHRQAP